LFSDSFDGKFLSMIFNKIFNKKNVRSIAALFTVYLFFGTLIFPFFSKDNNDKNLSERNQQNNPSVLTSADFWLSSDIIFRVSEKSLTSEKASQNQDANYLISYSAYHSLCYSVYFQTGSLTTNVVKETFSQASPRSPPEFLY